MPNNTDTNVADDDTNEAQLPCIKSRSRVIGLYGSLDEESAKPIIEELIYLVSEDVDKDIPINFVISTNGGLTSEMFAIYDYMIFAKKQGFIIKTLGLGKVMSAGVLLLSAGTKGERIIGANARLMIHEVAATFQGSMTSIGEEFKESHIAQKKYLSLLEDNSNIKLPQFTDYVKGGKNFYFNAEEAIEFGFVDKIL